MVNFGVLVVIKSSFRILCTLCGFGMTYGITLRKRGKGVLNCGFPIVVSRYPISGKGGGYGNGVGEGFGNWFVFFEITSAPEISRD